MATTKGLNLRKQTLLKNKTKQTQTYLKNGIVEMQLKSACAGLFPL